MVKRRGLFITFEGGDGSGKSTQIQLAAGWLKEQGYPVLVTREPGGTVIGEKIRAMLLDTENTEMADITEMLLYAAARAQLAGEVIARALESNMIVICDRWVDSSLVYQGVARGLGEGVFDVNSQAAGELFSPDVTILLDIDAEEAIRRLGDREEDRIESMGIEYRRKVRAGYLALAKSEPWRIQVIDASGSPEEVHELVKAPLKKAVQAFHEGAL